MTPQLKSVFIGRTKNDVHIYADQVGRSVSLRTDGMVSVSPSDLDDYGRIRYDSYCARVADAWREHDEVHNRG